MKAIVKSLKIAYCWILKKRYRPIDGREHKKPSFISKVGTFRTLVSFVTLRDDPNEWLWWRVVEPWGMNVLNK